MDEQKRERGGKKKTENCFHSGTLKIFHIEQSVILEKEKKKGKEKLPLNDTHSHGGARQREATTEMDRCERKGKRGARDESISCRGAWRPGMRDEVINMHHHRLSL